MSWKAILLYYNNYDLEKQCMGTRQTIEGGYSLHVLLNASITVALCLNL